MTTANQVTGADGRYLRFGIDASTLRPAESGTTVNYWDREVSYDGTTLLKIVLSCDKLIKYDLLASIVHRDEKVSADEVVSLYKSGSVKEIRHGKRRYRIAGQKYLGYKE